MDQERETPSPLWLIEICKVREGWAPPSRLAVSRDWAIHLFGHRAICNLQILALIIVGIKKVCLKSVNLQGRGNGFRALSPSFPFPLLSGPVSEPRTNSFHTTCANTTAPLSFGGLCLPPRTAQEREIPELTPGDAAPSVGGGVAKAGQVNPVPPGSAEAPPPLKRSEGVRISCQWVAQKGGIR